MTFNSELVTHKKSPIRLETECMRDLGGKTNGGFNRLQIGIIVLPTLTFKDG
jgi:hypothetical protein